MNFSDIKIPSNRKFGFFLTLVFFVAASYFFLSKSITAAYILIALVITFLLTTLFKADVLLPLNKLWMCFGILLGMIVSPIVLGLIFFSLFTPIAFLMRLCGRDELRLQFKKKSSHWIKRDILSQTESFWRQF
jgi:hypothetical protein